MTQIEQIKAEIERLYNTEAERFDTSQEIGAKRILDELSKYINSLPAEQPSEEFEKEVDKQWNEEYRPYDSGYTIAELSLSDYKETARHFAQWQKEQTINKASQCLNENVV